MAITRAQQYRQMLKEGSKKPVKQAGVTNYLGKQEMVTAPKFWLSEPGHVKAKLSYITDEEAKILIDKNLYGSLKGKPNIGPAGLPSLQGGDAGGLGGDGPSGNGDGPSNRDRHMGLQGKTGTKDTSLDGGGVDRSKTKTIEKPNIFEKTLSTIKKFSPTYNLVKGITSLFGPTQKNINPYSGGPTGLHAETTTDDDDDTGGGDGMPRYAQLGYPSQEAYMAAMQRATQAPAGLPAAVQPMQTMNLNRIAYRLMADGGFLGEEDEPRQAYGLGSIVKKFTKPIKKVVKKATSAVKKVVKSPLGKLALAVAAPYALGPAMAQSQFLMGLSAAQRAALISGATTGVTQLASGEDLDLKDIALSAALSGGVSKFTAPKGIDGKAFNASRASQASKFQMPRGGGADLSKIAASNTRPNMFDIAGPVRGGSGIVEAATKATKDPTIFSRIKGGLENIKDSKILSLAKKYPTLSILGASGLAGLAAKKDFEEDEFSEMDRGEGIDIAAIRRRPFEYMAPRFAGSEFDFYAADGGRIGYQEAGAVLSEKQMKKLAKSALFKGFKKMYSVDPQMAKDNPAYEGKFDMFKKIYDQKFQKGGKAEPVAKKVMPLLDMGGQEMDLRAEGGFVPIGRMEKADDVPARLSKNEFVFTAEAVRNAGEGDVDKGAEVMYNMMKNLEAGGEVSEESQGSDGARKMFQTSQRLEEVL